VQAPRVDAAAAPSAVGGLSSEVAPEARRDDDGQGKGRGNGAESARSPASGQGGAPVSQAMQLQQLHAHLAATAAAAAAAAVATSQRASPQPLSGPPRVEASQSSAPVSHATEQQRLQLHISQQAALLNQQQQLMQQRRMQEVLLQQQQRQQAQQQQQQHAQQGWAHSLPQQHHPQWQPPEPHHLLHQPSQELNQRASAPGPRQAYMATENSDAAIVQDVNSLTQLQHQRRREQLQEHVRFQQQGQQQNGGAIGRQGETPRGLVTQEASPAVLTQSMSGLTQSMSGLTQSFSGISLRSSLSGEALTSIEVHGSDLAELQCESAPAGVNQERLRSGEARSFFDTSRGTTGGWPGFVGRGLGIETASNQGASLFSAAHQQDTSLCAGSGDLAFQAHQQQRQQQRRWLYNIGHDFVEGLGRRLPGVAGGSRDGVRDAGGAPALVSTGSGMLSAAEAGMVDHGATSCATQGGGGGKGLGGEWQWGGCGRGGATDWGGFNVIAGIPRPAVKLATGQETRLQWDVDKTVLAGPKLGDGLALEQTMRLFQHHKQVARAGMGGAGDARVTKAATRSEASRRL